MVHTPSVFVKRIFQGELFEKRIEKRTVQKERLSAVVVGTLSRWTMNQFGQ